MIVFEKMKLQNFLSIGNKPIEVDLNHEGITLICGHNGSGKSGIFLYPIYYGLYGKSFSKTKLGSLVNNINGNGMVVELWFSIGDNQYHIKRGSKPNIFEIYVNGKLKQQLANTRDYQSYLEHDILKMDENTFKQLVVIGSTSYTPFMRLSLGERRIVVEDILDLSIFSKMLEKSKIYMVELDTEISANNEIQREITEKIHILEAKKEESEKVSSTYKASLERDLENTRKEIKKYVKLTSCGSYENKIKTLKNTKAKQEQVITEANNILTEFTTKMKSIIKTEDFFSNNSSCPTCGQDITKEVFDKKKNLILERKKSLQEKIDKCRNKLNELYKKKDDLIEELNEIIDLQEQYIKNIFTLNQLCDQEKELENKIKNIKGDVSETIEKINSEIIKYNQELTEKCREKDILLEKKNALTSLQGMLKDDGIKSEIISSYLPKLNQLVQHYLDICGFNIVFSFDNMFEASITDRIQENREYFSFSEGQRARIDIAILMAMRDLSKLRSSTSCNIITVDEFDGVLDTDGKIAFMEILKSISDTSIYIISHAYEEYNTYANRNFVVEKQNGFTRLKEI